MACFHIILKYRWFQHWFRKHTKPFKWRKHIAKVQFEQIQRAKTCVRTIVQVESKGTHSQGTTHRNRVQQVDTPNFRLATMILQSCLESSRASHWHVAMNGITFYIRIQWKNQKMDKNDDEKRRLERRRIPSLDYDCYCLHLAERRFFLSVDFLVFSHFYVYSIVYNIFS